jgi:hypothetical protein
MKERKNRTAESPKFAFREAGTQVSPVTMPCPSCSTLFAAVYKRPTEGGLGACAFAFLRLYFGLLDFRLFALGVFLPLNIRKKLLLWAFWCGKLLERKRREKLLKGKELLKG